MTHYELLGVPVDAEVDQIRRAYVRAARRAHPDVPGGDAARMRALNAAWEVLGDADARRDYDRRIGHTDTSTSRSRVTRPDSTFVPHAAYGRAAVDDPDDPDLLDDRGDPATALGRPAQLLPVVLWVASFASTCVGLVTGLVPVLFMGVVLAVLGGIGFLAAPLLAMGRATAVERSAEARRAARTDRRRP